MKQIYNPFLPLDEYIPDGEPHVFGDRVYLFGSHDKEAGDTFCMLDYCAYSAPVIDLTDWSCDGVIYSSSQDPNNDGKRVYMYAPDVVKGNDGRYYLYYFLAGHGGKGGFDGPISVAVSNTPGGKYLYYGDVKYSNGEQFKRMIPFDPAVINDDGVIRLYYGWALPIDKLRNPIGRLIVRKVMQKMFSKTKEEIAGESKGIMGANTVELAKDMLTVVSEPQRIIPAKMAAGGTSFSDHAFFEASSIRKIGETYYFIFSSHLMHELCYATSKYPDKDFVYGGVIISSGDIGYQGRLEKDRLNATGNNHGSFECIDGQWYIFYHRHTHNTSYSRQACAEPIQIEKAGTIPQVEMTSCGLNGKGHNLKNGTVKALKAEGEYPAIIACNLTDGKMKHQGNGRFALGKPYITSGEGERYITRIKNNVLIGYKYFDFTGGVELRVQTRGKGSGALLITTEIDGESLGDILGKIDIKPSGTWTTAQTQIDIKGEKPLYLKYKGRGKIDFISFTFS